MSRTKSVVGVSRRAVVFTLRNFLRYHRYGDGCDKRISFSRGVTHNQLKRFGFGPKCQRRSVHKDYTEARVARVY